MPVCQGCGKNYLIGKTNGTIKLCQSCWKNIGADKWISLQFATKDALENEKSRVVSLAKQLNFFDAMVNNISSYFDDEINAGFVGYADGGLSQSIRIYKDHCVITTNSDFPQGKMMNPYIKEGQKILDAADKKRSQALNEKQRIREEQVKNQTSQEVTNEILKHPGKMIGIAIKMGMGIDEDGSGLTRSLEKKYNQNMRRSERSSFLSDLSDSFSDVSINANNNRNEPYSDSASGFTTSEDMKRSTVPDVDVQNNITVTALDSASGVFAKAYGIKTGKYEIEYRNIKSVEFNFPEVTQGRFSEKGKAGYIRIIFDNDNSTAFFFDGLSHENSADLKDIYSYIKNNKDSARIAFQEKEINWEIEQYKELLNENIISAEEFEKKQNQLRNKLADFVNKYQKRKVRFCQFCGQPLVENAEYCIHCGRKVNI